MASSDEAAYDGDHRFADYDQTNCDVTMGMYTCQHDLFTTHLKFPMPGRESGNALRNYLQNWAPRIPLNNIPFNHLLNLQAVFWRETSSTIFATNLKALRSFEANSRYRWPDAQVLFEEVRAIASLLDNDKPHVFIAREKTDIVCNNELCPHARTAVKDCSTGKLPRRFTIEPLLDWGTVTPASDLSIAKGRIFPFRRNGVKMDDPLWYQELKKLVGSPTSLPTYCVECLEEAMARRAEAWGIGEQPACHGQLVIRRPTSEKEIYGGEGPYTIFGCEKSSVGGQRMDQREFYDHDQALNDILSPGSPGSGHVSGLQLDGANEFPSEKRQKLSWSISFGNDNIQVPVKHTVKAESAATLAIHRAPNGSFTPPPSPQAIHNVAPPQCTYASLYPSVLNRLWTPYTPPTSRASSSPSTSRNSIYRDPQSPEDYEKLGSDALLEDSVPDFSTGHRKVGRQIDTNLLQAICRKSIARRLEIAKEIETAKFVREIEMAKEKEMDKTQLGIKNFFTALNTPPTTTTRAVAGPSTPQRAAKVKNVDYEKFDLSELPSSLETDEDPEAPSAEYSPVKGKGKSPATPRKPKTPPTLRLTPTNTAKEKGPPYTPVHRKRSSSPSSNTIPEGVTEEAYLAHLEHVPEKTDKICLCGQAAKTYDVQLAQCANPSCTISWFHKDCLDKSGKIKARFGTYTCDLCHAHDFYSDLARKNGSTTKKLMQNELAMPFSGEQLASALPNMGGFTASADPYGLAMSPLFSTTLSPVAKEFKSKTGAAKLAELAVGSAPSLGLTTSRPYYVNEAYTNTAAHTEEANQEWEYAQQHGFYDVAGYEWYEDMGEGEGAEEDATKRVKYAVMRMGDKSSPWVHDIPVYVVG